MLMNPPPNSYSPFTMNRQSPQLLGSPGLQSASVTNQGPTGAGNQFQSLQPMPTGAGNQFQSLQPMPMGGPNPMGAPGPGTGGPNPMAQNNPNLLNMLGR